MKIIVFLILASSAFAKVDSAGAETSESEKAVIQEKSDKLPSDSEERLSNSEQPTSDSEQPTSDSEEQSSNSGEQTDDLPEDAIPVPEDKDTVPLSVLESNLNKLKRGLFKDAVKAIENGELDNFQALKAQSTDYILYPYLEYYDLRNRLSSATDDELFEFINKYQSTPLSYKIRTQWLYRLAEDQRWEQYLKVYKGQGGAKLTCAYLQAKQATNDTDAQLKQALRVAQKLWLSASHPPQECKFIFEKFEASKYLTSKMIWKRIELAFEHKNISLATALSEKLNKRDQKNVELWAAVAKDPLKNIESKKLRKRDITNRKIIVYGIKAIAARDADNAQQLWEKLQRRRGFGREQIAEIDKYIALRSAYQQLPDAFQRLTNIKSKFVDDDVRYWRAMVSLRAQDWKALKKSIEQLPSNEKSEPNWQYWLARSQQILGEDEAAKKIFQELAQQTNYYGFLAADRIGVPYSFNTETLKRDEEIIRKLREMPGIQRARELFFVGQLDDSRREWLTATRKFKADQLTQAAILSHDWGWHYNAIMTVARTNQWNDYDIRFPTPYRELVFETAKLRGIAPSLIYGIARRESAFRPNARSSVGALGLMQIMPATARRESKRLGRQRPSQKEILETENNIFLGSSYLTRMLERFGGNQALATAAYNAGPNRVDRWIPKSDPVSSDLWVETLPYKETREYVKAVLTYSTIFDWRLEQKITTLSARMDHVISKEIVTEANSIN